jgi:hypothetical protein
VLTNRFTTRYAVTGFDRIGGLSTIDLARITSAECPTIYRGTIRQHVRYDKPMSFHRAELTVEGQSNVPILPSSRDVQNTSEVKLKSNGSTFACRYSTQIPSTDA